MNEKEVKKAIRRASAIPLTLMILFVGALDMLHRQIFEDAGVPALLAFVMAVATSVYIFEKAMVRLNIDIAEDN